MSLFFHLRATETRDRAVTLGFVEIQRHEPLDLDDPAVANAVTRASRSTWTASRSSR